mgnify:CR=1 FL=1
MQELMQELKRYKKTPIKRFNGGGRWYSAGKTNNWKPSVTTIIGETCSKGKFFDEWLMKNGKEAIVIRDKAALNGTLVHQFIENLLNEETVEIDGTLHEDEFIQKSLMSFEKFWKEKSLKVIDKELFLYHKDIPWAGTPDIIAVINNCLSIIDIKTGDYRRTHEIQQLMYAIIWNRIFPNNPIEKIYGLYIKGKWKREPNYNLRQFKLIINKDEYNGPIADKVYDLWCFLNSSFPYGKPKPKEKLDLKKTFTLNIGEKTDVSSLL